MCVYIYIYIYIYIYVSPADQRDDLHQVPHKLLRDLRPREHIYIYIYTQFNSLIVL